MARICSWILLLVWVGVVARGEEVAGRGRLAIRVVESATLPAEVREDRFPLLTVGRLGAVGKVDRPGMLTDGILKGQKVLVSPAGPGATTFLLVSPVLNTGEFFEPVSLEREGNFLTLRVEVWADDGPRLQNVRHRMAHWISTDFSEAGEYTLRLELVDLFREGSKHAVRYFERGLLEGSTRFAIGAKGEAEDRPLARLSEKDMKNGGVKPAKAVGRQHVFGAAMLEVYGKRGAVQTGLRVGRLDLKEWLANRPAALLDVPELLPVDGRGGVHAAVLAPRMNSYEWISLRGVEWEENRCTIQVDVWRDTCDRTKNLVHQPLVILPLEAPGPAWPAGELLVRVKWNLMIAPVPNGLYVSKPDAEFLKGAIEEVRFVVK